MIAALIAAAIGWHIADFNSKQDVFLTREAHSPTAGLKRAWVHISLAEYGEGGASHYVTLTEFDCKAKRFRELKSTVYFKDGSNLGLHEGKPWKYPNPDTMGESVQDFVCNPLGPDHEAIAGDAETVAAGFRKVLKEAR